MRQRNGWAWHTQPGQPCEACRLRLVHYDTCDCGHCPPAIPRGTVMHVSLADRYAEYVAASHADMDGDQSPTSGSNPSIPTTK